MQRFGSANAEYVKGYRGVDNVTGQRLAKGLVDIAKHKVNDDPHYATQNIKQQAGFSAGSNHQQGQCGGDHQQVQGAKFPYR